MFACVFVSAICNAAPDQKSCRGRPTLSECGFTSQQKWAKFGHRRAAAGIYLRYEGFFRRPLFALTFILSLKSNRHCYFYARVAEPGLSRQHRHHDSHHRHLLFILSTDSGMIVFVIYDHD